MTALISKLEETIPNVREVMLASIKNVRTTHLLDPKLLGLNPSVPVETKAVEPQMTALPSFQIGEPSV